MNKVYDVVIVGGGINGCGCAADAALRGLSVLLCEQDDLASKTSSSSTKLIHGGLRYLEHYDFRMVKKALDERQTLLNVAPHLVKPLGLVLPHVKNMRPSWLIRMGLFIYDHLSRKNILPHTTSVNRNNHATYFEPLNPDITKGFFYYDGFTNDSRLSITNALQAQKHDAKIMTKTKLIHASFTNGKWHLLMQPQQGQSFTVKALSLINATGPWVEQLNQALNLPVKHKMALVKGSHIVTRKLYEGEHAYLLQHTDKRVIFVIPYFGHSMVGTTDVAFTGSPKNLKIDESEINYLLELVNHFFKTSVTRNDIITSWSGVRPLISSEGKAVSKVSRDYDYHFTDINGPLATIYGGKVTTYRQLSAKVVDTLKATFPNLSPSNTQHTPLPGAYFDKLSFVEYCKYAREKYSWLEPQVISHLLATYGTLTEKVLNHKNSIIDLGERFSKTTYQAEIDYLITHEWAQTTEDILWRRTKLGLTMNHKEIEHLERYLNNKE